MLQPQPRLYTVDEFYELIEDGQKADLIDGVIHVASPDTLLADQLNGFLYFLVGGFAEGRDLGKLRCRVSRIAWASEMPQSRTWGSLHSPAWTAY